MIVSTKSKQNENDDQSDLHVITYFNYRLKQVEKALPKDLCGQCRIWFAYRDRLAEIDVYIYTFQIVVNSAEKSIP